MSRLLRGMLITLFGFALVSTLVVVVLATMLPHAAGLADGGIRIVVDGDSVDLAALHGPHGWAGLALAAAGALVAVLVVLTVVPLAVLIALLAVAFAVGVVLLGAVAVFAVATSPLLLIGLLAWWLLRRRRPAPAVQSPA